MTARDLLLPALTGAAVGFVAPPFSQGAANLQEMFPQSGQQAAQRFVRRVPPATAASTGEELAALKAATEAPGFGSAARVADTPAGQILAEDVAQLNRPYARTKMWPQLDPRLERAGEAIEARIGQIIGKPVRLSVEEMEEAAQGAKLRARALYQQMEGLSPSSIGEQARQRSLGILRHIEDNAPDLDRVAKHAEALRGRRLWDEHRPLYFSESAGRTVASRTRAPDFEDLVAVKDALEDLAYDAAGGLRGHLGAKYAGLAREVRDQMDGIWSEVYPEARAEWRLALGLHDAPREAVRLWGKSYKNDVRHFQRWLDRYPPEVRESFRTAAAFDLMRQVTESTQPGNTLNRFLNRGAKLRVVFSEEEIDQLRQLRDAYRAMRTTSDAIHGSPTGARLKGQQQMGEGLVPSPANLWASIQRMVTPSAEQRVANTMRGTEWIGSRLLRTDLDPALLTPPRFRQRLLMPTSHGLLTTPVAGQGLPAWLRTMTGEPEP